MGRSRHFDPNEDVMLLKLVENEGTAWTKITREFSKNVGRTRTINSLRNRFQRIEKGQRVDAFDKSHCKQRNIVHVCDERSNDERSDDINDKENDIEENADPFISSSCMNIYFFHSIDMLGQSTDDVLRREAHTNLVNILNEMFLSN